MDEQTLLAGLDAAMGEALTGSLLQTAILAHLVGAGLVTREGAAAIIDTCLLELEEHRAAANRFAHIDHARSRLEALLTAYSTARP